MNKDLVDLYSDYLLSSFGATTTKQVYPTCSKALSAMTR